MFRTKDLHAITLASVFGFRFIHRNDCQPLGPSVIRFTIDPDVRLTQFYNTVLFNTSGSNCKLKSC